MPTRTAAVPSIATPAGTAERKGVELSYSGRWTETVSAYLALSVLDAGFKDGFTPTSGAAVAAGNALPGMPNRLAFGEIVWRPRLTGAMSGVQRPRWRPCVRAVCT
jgi:iron complex outermembrane receptor protein